MSFLLTVLGVVAIANCHQSILKMAHIFWIFSALIYQSIKLRFTSESFQNDQHTKRAVKYTVRLQNGLEHHQ